MLGSFGGKKLRILELDGENIENENNLLKFAEICCGFLSNQN